MKIKTLTSIIGLKYNFFNKPQAKIYYSNIKINNLTTDGSRKEGDRGQDAGDRVEAERGRGEVQVAGQAEEQAREQHPGPAGLVEEGGKNETGLNIITDFNIL